MVSSKKLILAIDQGTTSTKSLVIAADGRVLATSAPKEFTITAKHPQAGWVEFDPDQMLRSICQSAQAALVNARLNWDDIAAIGLANQGETVIAFDSDNGRPLGPAISWQDQRSQDLTQRWRAAGLEEEIFAATGLTVDPYFSASKFAWIQQHLPQARQLQAAGRLRLGTSDSWLLWQLSGGRQFVTDVSTASRTMLMDLATMTWSAPLCEAFQIPREVLPDIAPSATPVGMTCPEVLGAEVPVTGICVDQQAALFGQQALTKGQAKITYGTGCFLLVNLGGDSAFRAPGLLTSVGWQIGDETTYVCDGGVYSAGSLFDWMVELGLAADAAEIAKLAAEIDLPTQVMLIPAFSGLAAPRWSSRARACWTGMDQGTHRRHLARSALEAVSFRVREIVDTMREYDVELKHIRVDGGLSQCDVLMQMQADVLGIPLERHSLPDATALGVGYFAGLGCGFWEDPAQISVCVEEPTCFEARSATHTIYTRAFEKWKRVCETVVAMGEDGMFDDG